MSDAPRSYWRSIPDEQLIAARDEYRRQIGRVLCGASAAELERCAADIDDDLARRAAERDQRSVDAVNRNYAAIAGWGPS